MMRGFLHSDDAPELQVVLDALDDEDCRRIIETLTEPMSAKELSERCDIPLSTMYRKLELLTDAALVRQKSILQTDGHHTSKYELAFEEVVVRVNDEREVDVGIAHSPESTDERLETLWAEVRRET